MREIRLASQKESKIDEQSGSDSSSEEEKQDAKEENFRLWNETLSDVPDNYDFIIRSTTIDYPKGSQIYLSYGSMSNRDALKRYGFCLTQNKYNNIYIKLRLEQADPEFQYRQYIIQKFFSLDYDDDQVVQLKKLSEFEKEDSKMQKPVGSMDIMSRHFKIYY